MRAITAVLAAGVLLGGSGADAAAAAQPRQIAPGVFADPSTPAGKEYALQLQQARSTGSSSRSTPARSGSSLFGAGIAAKPATQRAAPAATAPPKRAAVRSPTRAAKARPPTTEQRAPAVAPAAAAVVAPAGGDGGGGGGGTLALVGGAAAILAVGGLGGVLLRRRRPLGPDAERRIG